MDIQQASSSTSPCPPTLKNCKYEVFLSFRGEDTRKNFTDHFYSALKHKGINAFRDDKNLQRGKSVSKELLQAIKDSRISVIIFSTNYATSTWCLDELAQAHECMKVGAQIVLPVFYGVDPSEVRKQTGRYGEAIAKHEIAIASGDRGGKVDKWKTALTEVANQSGWDLKDRHEAEAIQEIVEDIFTKLCPSCLGVSISLVGIDSRMDELIARLCVGLDDVRMVAICGMPGIGKTTLAKVVFDKLSSQFDGSCFLSDVREADERHDLVSLQEQLLDDILGAKNIKVRSKHQGINLISQRLRWRKVLVVLDDVSKGEQLESLAGSPDWFGPGSRVIFTTRDEHLSLKYGLENKPYRMKGLNREESFKFLCTKVFDNEYPAEGYSELLDKVVKYCGGLPLALQVLGSFFRGRSVAEWQSALARLKEIPDNDIMDKLQISFNGLEETEKKIFLDIACFFKGEKKDYITAILDACGFYPAIGLSVLKEKSLVTIDPNNHVSMHDLLQQMGREIVRQESPQEPGNRSRLWCYRDAYHVLQNDTGTDEVEGIVLDSQQNTEGCLSAKAFRRMTKVRLLKLKNMLHAEHPEYLSNELRSLHWHKYPSKSLPSTFQPDNLVELILCHSNIQRLWSKTKALPSLRLVDLHCSKSLIKMMDFKLIPNLERLNLAGCARLVEIHPSIGVLRKLVNLNLRCCMNLKGLPSSICNVTSLQVLNLNGCKKLDKLPENLGKLTCLTKFDVGETGITELPSSLFLLQDLKLLSLQRLKGSATKSWNLVPFQFLSRRNMDPIAPIMISLPSLCSLDELDLSYCNLKDGSIPNDLSCLPSLSRLHLSGNDFVSLPASIGQMSRLEHLCVRNCKRLKTLPEFQTPLDYIAAGGCISLEIRSNLREGITLGKASHLGFINCFNQEQVRGNIEISWLKSVARTLVERPNQDFMSMVVPGNEIPRWFRHQAVGASCNVKLHQGWCNHDFFGFAGCAIFGNQSKPNPERTACNINGCSYLHFGLFPIPSKSVRGSWNFDIWQEGPLASDQLLLLFLPAGCLARRGSEHWWNTYRRDLEPQWWTHKPGLEVKKCGFRLVYQKDMQELIR